MCFGKPWALALIACVTIFATGGCQGQQAGPKTGQTGPDEKQAANSLAATTGDCAGAIVPTLETIEDGTYKPLSRPLFIYVNKKALQKPVVAGYVKTIFGAAQDQIAKSGGFIKLNEKILAEQVAKLDEALKGVTLPEKLDSGTVAVSGSSTVFPFSAAAAQIYEEANKGVRVTVGKKGTGGGFEKFCAGEIDINNASRAIKQEEIDKCRAANIEYIEFSVCIDGLSVCVNPQNDWCHCLSVEQLKKLFEPDSKVTKWKDLDPKWPDTKIVLYGPDPDSGTFEYFTEVIVGKAKSSRADYTQSTEDNVLVRGVSGDKNAIGYFGYSYYDKNRSKLKAVGIKPAQQSEAKK